MKRVVLSPSMRLGMVIVGSWVEYWNEVDEKIIPEKLNREQCLV
jgi:hypothetical protein